MVKGLRAKGFKLFFWIKGLGILGFRVLRFRVLRFRA